MTTTTRPEAKKRPAAGAPGVNGLITAVAVAATLGGWAVLSLTRPDPAGASPVEPAGSASAQPAAAQASITHLRQVAPPPVAVTRSSR